MTDREAMKLALDALERSMEAGMTGIKVDQAIAALRQALAEPDMGIDRGAWDDVPDATKWVDELRGGDETEEEEPVAYVTGTFGGYFVVKPTDSAMVLPEKMALYSAPPKREWQGLTDEERYLNDCRSEEEIEYARAIEAKLKEKNT